MTERFRIVAAISFVCNGFMEAYNRNIQRKYQFETHGTTRSTAQAIMKVLAPNRYLYVDWNFIWHNRAYIVAFIE